VQSSIQDVKVAD